MTNSMLSEERARFHATLVDHGVLVFDNKGVASNADGSQTTSRFISASIATDLGAKRVDKKLSGQRVGKLFEDAVQGFLAATAPRFPMLRPGDWEYLTVGGSRGEYHLARYEPYRHLDDLALAIEKNRMLSGSLGNSYEISPDVLVIRQPESDEFINRDELLVDPSTARYSPLRRVNQDRGILHAVVSCKWTLRSDRAQNARSEALNVIRHRKGRTPHIVVVTGEPTPSRLASLALGTGDLDTVYHFALPELISAVDATNNDEAIAMLTTLVDGKRLRDISDLPLDLAT